MIAEFDLTVLYSQIVVFEMPFHDMQWTDDHVAQGFAWSPGDVGFGVPDDDGMCRIEVIRSESFELDPHCLWAVQVPFDVKSGDVMVGSVIDPREIQIERGVYNLAFEALEGPDGMAFLIRLHFVPTQHPGFAILKRGTELQTDHVLREDTEIFH